MTTERFTEYPVELRDANGQAVLTKRTYVRDTRVLRRGR